jgi:hypothetical protein
MVDLQPLIKKADDLITVYRSRDHYGKLSDRAFKIMCDLERWGTNKKFTAADYEYRAKLFTDNKELIDIINRKDEIFITNDIVDLVYRPAFKFASLKFEQLKIRIEEATIYGPTDSTKDPFELIEDL